MATTKKATAKKATAKKTTTKKATKKVTIISNEDIQAKAYQIYVEKGYQGSEVENWLQAEKELA